MKDDLVRRLRALNLLTTQLEKEDWRKAATLALKEVADMLEMLEGKSDRTETSKKDKNIKPH
jgi:hypothetical protein